MTPLHDFAHRYHATRSIKLAALADAALADGDQELANLYFTEAQRKVEVVSPPHLRVLPSAGSK